MRDILEDAEGAIDRGDIGPGKSNRGQDKPSFPKRFYSDVTVEETGHGFIVKLDGKSLKTPGKNDLVLPTRSTAQCVADEWAAVEDEINPLKLPITRLANTAVDGVANEMQAVMEDITRYAASDLLCYRADTPEGLQDKQREHWDPVLDWALSEFGASFEITTGIMSIAQPKEAIAAFGQRLKAHEDAFKLTALHTFTSITGSAILALAIAEKFLDEDKAWQAAHVDEDWNISQWGEDFEAAERRKQRQTDFKAAHKLFITLG